MDWRRELMGGLSSGIDINNYLTIEALEDGLVASLSTNACEYCIDGDGNWKTLAADTPTETINTGQILSFRGNLTPNLGEGIGTFTILKKCNLKGNCMSMLFKDNAANNYSLSGKNYAFCELFWNCENIVNVSSNFLPATTLASNCYFSMFDGCTSLTTAPELPATTLERHCYGSMFSGCISLAIAPELPATTLKYGCYIYMFYNCTKLTAAPELSATTLASGCYNNMFNGCSKLNYIKMLATDISASNCLYYWVNNVSSTGTFVKKPAMTTLPTGHSGIPEGWTVVDDRDTYLTIEALEDGLTASLSTNACEYCVDSDGNWKSLAADTATESINSGQTLSFRGNLTLASSKGIGTFTISKKCNLKGNCMSMLFKDNAASNYSLNGKNYAFYMLFKNCKNIVNVSGNFLPATTLSNYCYYYMFYYCTSLTTAPELPATTLASHCYDNMFRNCTNLITAPELPATTLASSCYYFMFYDCDSLTIAPELPATTLASSCYNSMFSGCNALTTAPTVLPATTLAEYCYDSMFNGCRSLTTVPELPATTLAEFCYDDMFRRCISLTTAPSILPATTLERYCYTRMFSGCTSLTTAPDLPATTLASNCYESMFDSCTSLTTAPTLPATTLSNWCYRYMFEGCTKLNYIKMLATDISARECLNGWVDGVASTGTFIKNPNMTSLPTGSSGIPSGWTVVDNEEGSDDGEDSDGNNEITFYINGQGSITPVKALSGMTWGEFVNSEYANQNSVYTNFRLLNMGSYNGIMFYHEDAMYDMILCNDSSHVSIVRDNDIIEDGKTYYAY